MNWFKNFMAGRYGGDQLSMALLILSIILTFVAQQVRLPILGFISYIPIVIVLYRMFSRDIVKRSQENYKFCMFFSPVSGWLKKLRYRAEDAKTYKYFKCPTCDVKLRVPRGKGKIIITCPKCKTQFTKRT